jgi:ketosteroid isomerase-like protein
VVAADVLAPMSPARAEDNGAVALRFLDAYWKADLDRALGECTSTSVIELPGSALLPTPAALADVLPVIFGRVYPRFVGRTFSVTVERCLSDASVAIVEYRATGDLVNGRRFDCRYLAVLEVADGRVCRFRPYTDTKYIEVELLAC